jgi:hypothetical protein
MSQTRAVLSSETVTTSVLPMLKAADMTELSWVNRASSCPVATSHSRAVPSWEAVMTLVPSVLKEGAPEIRTVC